VGREDRAVSAEGVKVSVARHPEWCRYLATGLALSLLTLAAQAEVAYVDKQTNETARGGAVFANAWSLVDMDTLALPAAIYVDAYAPGDPAPGDPDVGDPHEDGTLFHPFDTVFEAMAVAADGDTILVAPGYYAPAESQGNRLEFAGRNIQLKSTFDGDPTQIEQTILDATIVFDGTEGPQCELSGFKIQGPAFEGISGNGTAATLQYCAIQGNRTCDGSVLTDFHGHVRNCLIADNTSKFECGSRPAAADFAGTMTNCTIANNATGISVDTAEIVNCIIYHNDIQTIYVQDHGALRMSYTNVQGGEPAILAAETATLELTSIIALNPHFARLGTKGDGLLAEGDYHLKSQGLRWSPDMTSDSHWVRDGVTSPCVDTGDPASDIGAEPMAFPPGMGVQSPVNQWINMGYYGGTPQASLPFVDEIPGTIKATASSANGDDTGPEKTCNRSGLNDDDEHSTRVTDMWLTDDADEAPWILYEFDRVYLLHEMWVWNFNVPFEFLLGYGAKDVTITCSENGTDWTVLGDVQFAQASSAASYTANTIVPLGGVSARYVKLTVHKSWGTMNATGLSEVRFFADRTPLWYDEQDPRAASNPYPADGQTDIVPPVKLTWTPGDEAGIHRLYLGTDFDAVSNVQTTDTLGMLLTAVRDANALYLEKPLQPGQTYYWRVDETTQSGSTQTKGAVWSFIVSPYAYPIQNIVATSNATSEEGQGPENTINASGLNADNEHSTQHTDMWLGRTRDEPIYIQYEFDAQYELSEMWVWNYNVMFEALLGFGIKDVTIEVSENGTDWTTWGDVQFAQAPATPDYTANTIVPLDGVAARYVKLKIRSGWGRLGQFGLSEVRFFSSQPPSSPIWSYALVLDSFESYDSLERRIFDIWLDGWINETSSTVGYFEAPFAERWIVNSGTQSMPLFYNNALSPFYSETYRELEEELQDWNVDGAEALTLYFHGSTEKDHDVNTDRLYVAVQDHQNRIAVVRHPDREALLADGWQVWTIPLERFAGVDLTHVQRLIMGVGDRNNPRRGGNSVVYIDDIGLSAGPLGEDDEP
jgi:hypothetical protein